MPILKRVLFLALLIACDGSQGELLDGGGPDAPSASDAGADVAVSDSGDAGDAGPARGPARVYVGSSDGDIRVFAFDETTYALTPIDTTATGGNPSFLAFDAARAFLYAVDESNSEVRAFAIDAKTGKLASLGAVSSLGQGPAYVGLDRAGTLVMAANYGDGTISAFPRLDGGALGDASATYSFGASAHSHEIVADPSNAFVLVPNLGLGVVAVFRKNGLALTWLADTPAAGARHVAFDPAGAHAYVIDEPGSDVFAFDFDPQTGALSPIQTTSSLFASCACTNTGAEIAVTADGKHVVVSNRGDDSLVVFDVGSDGRLAAKARVPSGGQTPRQFQIDETGRFLFVGNQTSGSVVTMKVDPVTGIPSPVGTPLAVSGPEFVGLIYLP